MKKALLALLFVSGSVLANEPPAIYDHLKETTKVEQTVVGCVEVKGGCLGVALYSTAKTNTLTASNDKTPVSFKDAGIAWTYKF